jgi:hypothetical protein
MVKALGSQLRCHIEGYQNWMPSLQVLRIRQGVACKLLAAAVRLGFDSLRKYSGLSMSRNTSKATSIDLKINRADFRAYGWLGRN